MSFTYAEEIGFLEPSAHQKMNTIITCFFFNSLENIALGQSTVQTCEFGAMTGGNIPGTCKKIGIAVFIALIYQMQKC